MARVAKDKNEKITRFILYFFLIMAILLTYFMSNSIVKSVYGNIKSSNWVQVEAHLLSASIKVTKSSKSSSNSTQYTYYAPQIAYKYDFNGTNCIGSKVAWMEGGDNGPLEELAYKYKSYYKAGKAIEVFVNPDKPCESVADRAIYWSKFITFGIMIFVSLLFASGVIYLLVKTAKR